MSEHSSISPGLGALSAPRRNHYFYGKLLDEHDFRMEQEYFNRKRWLLNRLGLGSGVLCGLEVAAKGGSGGVSPAVCISPGVAVDALGREIIVPQAVCLDPWKVTGECGQVLAELDKKEAAVVQLCLSYRECFADYLPAMVTDCNTADQCAPGMIVEGFCIHVRPGAPEKPAGIDCPAVLGTGSQQSGGYALVNTIETGGRPTAIAAAHNGQRLLVVDPGSEAASRLLVIDTASDTVLTELTGNFSSPVAVTIAPEGGPAFVSHQQGILVVDLDATPPKITGALPTDKAYGAIAAAQGGKLLFAAETQGKLLEFYDVAAGKLLGSIKNISVSDLAVTPDSKFVYASNELKNLVLRIDTATGKVVAKIPTGPPAVSIAALSLAAGSAVYMGRTQNVRIAGPGDQPLDFPLAADVRDSAFTTDQERYYVVNRNPDAGEHELVIFKASGLQELGRVVVGEGPRAVAILPGRLRAYVANSGAGTVSVVDVPVVDHRRQACETLSGPCAEPDEHPCVTLAVVELLPGGEIGKLDACGYRRTLYSNEMLFEMILCLMARIDECCAQSPAPQPTPTPPPPSPTPPPPSPTPPPPALLKVKGVQFLNANNQVVTEMVSPTQTMLFKEGENVTAMRVFFTGDVDHGSIIAGSFGDDPAKFSLLVTASWSDFPMSFVPGTVTPEDATTTRFTIHPEFKIFRQGEYKIFLFGDKDPANQRPAITDMKGQRLDGEPGQLPSGNGSEGGDFVFVAISA